MNPISHRLRSITRRPVAIRNVAIRNAAIRPAVQRIIAGLNVGFTVAAAAFAIQVDPIQAAPPKRKAPAGRSAVALKPPLSKTLTFDVSAKLSSNGGDAMTLASRVWAKGSRVRIETKLGDRAVVFLAAPPYLYKLIPSAKAGVRWKSAKLGTGRFDIASLFDPTAIRSELKSRGAKSSGTQTLNGTVTDIYEAANVGGRGTDITAWLRRGDALPLKVETRSKSLTSVVTWSNYRHNTAVAESLFEVPVGYNVRESQGKPGLF